MHLKEDTKLDFKSPYHLALAVVTLYKLQTPDEKLSYSTIEQNAQGFNGADAGFGSSLAQQLLANRPLSRKQLAVLSGMLPKYQRQLIAYRWWTTKLPEGVDAIMQNWGKPDKTADKPKVTKPTLTGQGLVRLDEKERLEFVPNVYPTPGLKGEGWKRGDCPYWTWVAHFNLTNYNYLLRLYPDVVTDEEVQTLLDQLTATVPLPEPVAEHEILFPFQKESIQFLNSSPKAMLALAPGLGKTACSIFAADIAENSNHILVVAPLTLVQNWQREIDKWLGEGSVRWHGGKTDKWPSRDRWVVTNYATVSRNLAKILSFDWDIVIVDESILVKNRKAQRTSAIKTLVGEVGRAWLLSGSPTSRFYDDLWAQLNILHPKRFSSYWRFTKRYCVVEDNGWGMQITANKFDAAQRLQEDLADIYFARTQDQVLDLPPWLFETYEIELYPDQWKKYQQMEMVFWADLGEGEIVLSPNVLSQITRLIQLASNPSIIGGKGKAAKWDAAVDMLEWVEKPAIIWTNFIDTGNKVAERIAGRGYTVAVLTGQTKEDDRQEIVDRFQAGDLDVIVAHPKVGKFGLTLTRARTAIYLERNYEGDNYYQSLHRVRRIGTAQSPVVYHLLASGPNGTPTIDHIIDRILTYRKDSSFDLTTSILLEAKEKTNEQNI